MILKQDCVFEGHGSRPLHIHLPDDYDQSQERYPVMYFFDGHNLYRDEDATYGKSWGMGEYLDGNGVGLIVVAVDCNHRAPNGRLCEYSPFNFADADFGNVQGRGKRFMDWLTGTLKPIIDERYPTLPGRETTWIAGSSMGGLMSLYAVTAYNHVFGRAAALSPSVWIVGGQLTPVIRQAQFAPATVVYLD